MNSRFTTVRTVESALTVDTSSFKSYSNDIDPSFYDPLLYAEFIIRRLIGARHQCQYELPNGSVSNLYDQVRLLRDMQRRGITLQSYGGIFKIFSDPGLIRRIYSYWGRSPPKWFLKKY